MVKKISFIKKYYWKIIFLPTTCFGKDFFCCQKSITSTFPISQNSWTLPFFLIWTFLFCKVHVFIMIYLFLSLKLVSYNHFKINFKAKRETELNNFFFSMFRYKTMSVPTEIPLRRIWHLNFAETKKRYQHFNWDSYQTWSNTIQ